MALIGMIPEGSTPGKRVRALAEGMGECRKAFMTNTLSGPRLMLYQKLSSLMCWDAALLCAWAAKGIDSPSISLTGKSFGIVEDGSPDKLFPTRKKVNSAAELMLMPEGCLVGFINNSTGKLRLVMRHASNGMGAGNKSGCIFSDSKDVWEVIDMGQFFFKDSHKNSGTSIIYEPVKGQTV